MHRPPLGTAVIPERGNGSARSKPLPEALRSLWGRRAAAVSARPAGVWTTEASGAAWFSGSEDGFADTGAGSTHRVVGGCSAGRRQRAGLNLQSFTGQEGILLGVSTQEPSQHDTCIHGPPGTQDVVPVIHAHLQGETGQGWGEGRAGGGIRARETSEGESSHPTMLLPVLTPSACSGLTTARAGVPADHRTLPAGLIFPQQAACLWHTVETDRQELPLPYSS